MMGIIYKGAFLRHETVRVVYASGALVFILALFLSHRALWIRTRLVRLWVTALSVGLIALCIAGSHLSRQTEIRRLAERLGQSGTAVSSIVRLLCSPTASFQELIRKHEHAVAQMKDRVPTPHAPGSWDIYPFECGVPIAHGLLYHPRPVFQSYSAYTGDLLEINRRHLTSERGPDNILFRIGPIDDRLPSLDDSTSWPEVLVRYSVHAMTNGFVWLQRLPVPATYSMKSIARITAPLGVDVPLPSVSTGALIWVRSELQRSTAGTGYSLLYHPPWPSISLLTHSGGAYRYRFIPEIGAAGFLLSPLVRHTPDFEALGRTHKGDERVTSFCVDSPWRWAFRPTVRYEFFLLAIREHDSAPNGADPPK
jgi:hypothetical protein